MVQHIPNLGNRMFPASGLLKTNLTGEFRASAVHLDLPYAVDLWVFLLRSPWQPLKIGFERACLNLKQGSSKATAQIHDRSSGDESALRAYMSVRGSDLKNIMLSLKRKVQYAKSEEVIGRVVSGGETFDYVL